MTSSTPHRRALLALACAPILAACTTPRPAVGSVLLEETTRVVYEDHAGPGSGAPVIVLVHGWSCDRSVWQLQVEELAASARVLAVDLPGHGASDVPDTGYDMDSFARAILGVLDHAGVERAVLVGHSNGTPVVRQFYRRYPERTAGLVAVDGALRSFFPSPQVAAGFIGQMKGPGRMAFLEPMVDGMMPQGVDEETRANLRATMLGVPEHVQVESFEASVDPAIWVADPIEVPLLAVYAESPFWTKDYAAFVRELAPRLDYHDMTGVSHFLMMDEPEAFNALLLEWMAREVGP